MTIAWIEFQHCCVDELAITFGNTSGGTASKVGFLHFKKSFIEGGGIQALTPIFLGLNISACSNEIRLGNVSKDLHFGWSIRSGRYWN